MTDKYLDNDIQKIFEDVHLTGSQNSFFTITEHVDYVPVRLMYEIALNWREIARIFLFTTIKGLGIFSEALLNNHKNISEAKLVVLQSAFTIVSDDLSNINSEFEKLAPKGIQGIHYIWWENSILKALKNLCNEANDFEPELMQSAKKLIKGMINTCDSSLGFSVQLRVVETIALKFVQTFRELCSITYSNNKKIILTPFDYSCVDAHINAEIYHHNQVIHESNGMSLIAETPTEKILILELTQQYASLWAVLFNEFSEHILKDAKLKFEDNSAA